MPRWPEREDAWDSLHTALLDAARRELRVPCAGQGNRFLHFHPGHRAKAARECSGCPVWDACDRAGSFATFGVYGGRDRTLTNPKKKGKTNGKAN